MKIVYLTAGAAGMYCGSCMHDNTLAKAISSAGVDIELVPTYTPIRTDENSFAVDQVFFGGINVYLQQKLPFLRFLPNFLDRFLDSPWLIRRVTRNASNISATELGKLAVSMLKGEQGNQRKEVKRLCRWLKTHSKPDVVLFTNILIGGCIPALKRELGVKIIVTLQGDDIFLDSLPDKQKQQCLEQIKKLVPEVDFFIAHSEYYANFMSDFLTIPREQIKVTPLGIDVEDFEPKQWSPKEKPTIGYLARLAPEKGLDILVDTFIEIHKRELIPDLRLKIAGWLGDHQKEFADEQFNKLKQAGLEKQYEYVGSVDRKGKVDFLGDIDVLSVPTVYKEPKGLFVLEALASGVPYILPAHGAFPEIHQATQAGKLYTADDQEDFVKTVVSFFENQEEARRMSELGLESIRNERNAEKMAQVTLKLLQANDTSTETEQ